MILTLTVNPALDLYTIVDKIESSEKLRCASPTKDPGGGGVNVSRVIKRLGGDSTAVYTKGGYTGEMFSALLKNEDIKQAPVSVNNDLRQNFAVTETSTGDLYRFGMPGPTLEEPEYDEILRKIDEYSQANFLVASGSLPPNAPVDFYAEVAKRAKKNNIKFVLDTSGKAFSAALKEGVYLVKPNMKELQDLTGKQVEKEEDQKKLLLEFQKHYNIEIIVASLGAKGAFLAKDGRVRHYPAPRVEHVSSIGAGDSMVAGIVFSLSRGNPIEKAILYGLACGSATIKSPGTELLQKRDVEELYAGLVGDSEKNNFLSKLTMENKTEKKPTDLPSALQHFQEITAAFKGENPLLFLDFDGTLAPIVEHHDDAAISDEMRSMVEKLATKYPLAVVSGRGLADVRKRVNLPQIFYAGSHGFEISGPDDFSKDHEEAVKVIPVFDEIEPLLKEKLKHIKGTDFERKKFTLAIHYRQVKPAEEAEVHSKVEGVLKDYPEVNKADGKKVIEIRPAIDWHKGKAVEFLKNVLSDAKNPFSVYVGDDVTDEDAFEYVQNGLGILVGEHGRQTYADYRVEDLNEVKLLFENLLRHNS